MNSKVSDVREHTTQEKVLFIPFFEIYFQSLFLLMKHSDKVCIKILINSERERDLYRKRQDRYIQGTPKIILGKAEPNLQQIWIDELRTQQIAKLKEYNHTQKAYAKTIVNACVGLANHYGYFIINENMVFFNQHKEVFAWINPDVCQNHVKIYLPRTHDGELAMIRSIVAYLKLWFKCDYALLSEVQNLSELSHKIQTMSIKRNEGFKAKSPEREFWVNRRNSINIDVGQLPQRYQDEGKGKGQHLLMQNKSMKNMIGRSPGKESDTPNFLTSSLSGKLSSPLKFQVLNPNDKQGPKNRTTLVSQKNGKDSGCSGNSEFQHRTFNNLNSDNMIPLNKSVGIKGQNSYYPNKTTSNKNNKNHIVALISKQDTSPLEYAKNKLLLEEHKIEEYQKERLKRGKESLDGIGEELNDLFHSNIENNDDTEQQLKKVEEQFSTLLE